jgi:putative PEP-CTERM system histidine kinase
MPTTLSVTEFAFYSASLLSFFFSIIITIQYRKLNIGLSFCIACYINTLWLLCSAYINPVESILYSIQVDTHHWRWTLCAEILRYSFWVFALTKLIERQCEKCLPAVLSRCANLVTICGPLATAALMVSDLSESYALKFLSWSGLGFSIFCLLLIEQLYRNIFHDRLIRLLSISLALIFFFDAFLHSQILIEAALFHNLWQVRASLNITMLIFMAISVITMRDSTHLGSNLSLSRPVAFYTSSLTISGTILIILATGGYYIRLSNASWGSFVYATIVSLGIAAIVVTFTSRNVQRKLNVIINKHLFHYKYDYRSEWLKLIRLLSQPSEDEQISQKAIDASANLFRCRGGAIWQKKGHYFVSTASYGETDTRIVSHQEKLDTPFIQKLEQGWIFAASAQDPEISEHNELIPTWLRNTEELWLVCPLLVENELTGYMALSHPTHPGNPNWEDLDLAKTVGRQVANFILRHEQSELLAQARQFEAFNKLSAFVMHDLKNLIAQQSLLVKNAEKHKDNPAFVEDTINTIRNSVDRMNNLLRKLKQNEPEEIKIISVKSVLIEAVKRCQRSHPAPSLQQVNDNIHVKADFDSFVMVFTHLIHNAQDATNDNGFIDIYTKKQHDHIIIFIEDNGEGMSKEFIETKLFQPFQSTKAGKGMGVGVYQAREYIESLKGEVSVESTPGQGTKFTLRIPIAET